MFTPVEIIMMVFGWVLLGTLELLISARQSKYAVTNRYGTVEVDGLYWAWYPFLGGLRFILGAVLTVFLDLIPVVWKKIGDGIVSYNKNHTPE